MAKKIFMWVAVIVLLLIVFGGASNAMDFGGRAVHNISNVITR